MIYLLAHPKVFVQYFKCYKKLKCGLLVVKMNSCFTFIFSTLSVHQSFTARKLNLQILCELYCTTLVKTCMHL